jgi:predicted site-specific integrase-resolvase
VDLKEWAAVNGISYATARRRFESGTLPVPTYRIDRLIMVGEPVTGMLGNRRLARHVADAGFAEIRRQLAYKTGRLIPPRGCTPALRVRVNHAVPG